MSQFPGLCMIRISTKGKYLFCLWTSKFVRHRPDPTDGHVRDSIFLQHDLKKNPKQFSEIRKWDFLTWNMHDDNCWLLKAKWVNVWKMRGCQIGISFYYWLMFNCGIWIMKPDCLFINPDITNCEYWVIWWVARS